MVNDLLKEVGNLPIGLQVMESRSNFRFSVLGLFMMTTVVALITVGWKQYVQYRDELGVLTIRDKTKLHAIESPQFSPSKDLSRERAWRIWVPDGTSFELHFSTGWLDNEELPDKSLKGPITLGPGEHVARATLMTWPQSNSWHVQLATPDEKRAIHAKWLNWRQQQRFDWGVKNRTVAKDPDEKLLLWAVQVENSTNQQRDGLFVWLQPTIE